jgi:hypothetical protein
MVRCFLMIVCGLEIVQGLKSLIRGVIHLAQRERKSIFLRTIEPLRI